MEFNFIVYTVPNCSECDDVKEFIIANSNPSENIDHLKLTVIEYIGDGKDLKKFISEMKQNVAVFKRENTAVFI